MTKILIMSTTPMDNRGSMGRLIGAISCLKQNIPDVHITFMHRYYARDKAYFHKYVIKEDSKIEIRKHPWYRETVSRPLTALYSTIRLVFLLSYYALIHRVLCQLKLPLKDKYQQYDVVVILDIVDVADLSLDSTLGAFFGLFNTLFATTTKKPVVVWAASLGPLRSRILRALARYTLNRVNIITVREEVSKNYLETLGINKPKLYVTGDLAFLLEPISGEELDTLLKNENITSSDKPLVGIAPGKEPSSYPEKYLRLMAELTDYVIESLDATVIYISHTYHDKPVLNKIYQLVKNKDKVWLISDVLLADEAKGIIGICDFFISLRFHALLAAMSLAIPSLGIVSYSRNKFHGIFGKMMGQEKCLISMDRNWNYDVLLGELTSKIDCIWSNRDLLRKELMEKAKAVKELALLNGELIKELVNFPEP